MTYGSASTPADALPVLAQAPAQEPIEQAADAVADEVDPAGEEQYLEEQDHEEYALEATDDDAEHADGAGDADVGEPAEAHYEQVRLPDISTECAGSAAAWERLLDIVVVMCPPKRSACAGPRQSTTWRLSAADASEATSSFSRQREHAGRCLQQAAEGPVPAAPAESEQLEEWQRMQIPPEWLPSPNFWVRLVPSTMGGL